MEKFKPIRMLMMASILLIPFINNGQCDPPEAICMDVTITLDSTGQYILDPSEVDVGSTAPCGLQSMTLDNATFTCADVNPQASPAALFQWEAGDTLQNAGEIKVDATGNVYVADINDDVIYKFDAAGNLTQTIGVKGFGVGKFASLRGIEVDASGNIYGTDDNRDKILVFNSGGTFQFEFGASGSGTGQFTNPWRLSVSSSGIYVTDNVQDKILVFDASGTFQYEFGSFGTNPGDLDNPTNIDHDTSGNVYVLDQHRRKVIKYDAAGNFISEFGEAPSGGVFEGRLDIVEGLAVGGDGNIYIADRSSTIQNNKIMVYDNTGNFIYEFGNTGETSGKFGWAYAVAVDANDNLYVSDLVRDLYLVFDQAMVGNLVTLTVTDVNGDSACCVAEVTVLEGNGCTAFQDMDMDGFTPNAGDCDDSNPDIYPGATERCNGIDDNCDGTIDEDLSVWSGDYIVSSQADVDNFGSYSQITGELKIQNTNVTDLTPFSCLVQVGKLFIQDNNSLTSLDGMENLQLVDDYLVINYNPLIIETTQFASLLDVGNYTQFIGNASLEVIDFPALQSTGNNNTALHVHSNSSLIELSFPQLSDVDGLLTIRQNPLLFDLDFSSLLVAEDVDLQNLPIPDLSHFAHLNTVTGMFYVLNLDSLTTLDDLDMVDIQGGISLFFNDNLTSLGSLGTSTSFSENVYIQYNPVLPSLVGMEDITSISGVLRITNNDLLTDCCAISDLLDSGNVNGEVTIEFNPQFCGSETEIINFCTDDDGDGFSIGDGDCDDTDPLVFPGATERCNGIDDNCDGTVDEDLGVWNGNFFVTSQADLDNWGSYSEVTGNLNIINTDVTDLSPLSCLRKTKQLVITGNQHLQSLAGLENLEIITGSLRIVDNDSLTQITEMVSLDTVGFNMGLSDNERVETISFPALRWAGDLVYSLEVSAHPVLHTVSCPVLERTTADLQFFTSPVLTNYHFPVLSEASTLNFNQVGITDLSAFSGVLTIGDLLFNTCPDITDLSGLNNTQFQGSIFLQGCTSLSSLGDLGTNTSFTGGITIRSNPNLESLEGMDDITSIGGNLTIQYNAMLSDCCSIAELLDQGGVSGNVTISNNPSFCSSSQQIIETCLCPPPIAQCNDVTIALDEMGVATILATDVDGGSIGCSNLIYEVTQDTFNVNNLGNNPVTLTVTDTLGQMASCTAIVTVIDTILPTVVSCGGGGYFLPDSSCEGSINYDIPTFIDNTSGGPVEGILVSGPAPGDTFPSGPTEIIYEYYDAAGNGPVVCSFNVIGLPQCEDVTISLENGSASITGNDFFPQACPGVTYDIFLGQTTFDCSDVGNTYEIRTLIIHEYGQHTCTAYVTIADDGGCADDDGDGFTVNDGDCDDDNATVYPGAVEICNGIDDDCNGLVDLEDPNLVDTEAPVFTSSLPVDITVSCDNVGNSDAVEFTDNCYAIMEFRQISDWDGTCGNYQITRTWTVTDVGSNSISHTQLVTVIDNAPPSFVGILPGDVIVNFDSVPAIPEIDATDECFSGQHIYMEMEPIDSSNASLTLEGTLGDVGVTWTLEGVDVTQYKFRDVYTDNSLTTFSNGSFFTPAASGLDGAGFNAISGDASLRITFDQPVDNPVLHINNIDISRWDFNPTTDHISLVSGNDQIDIVNGVVVDVDPATSGGLDSGLGSVMVHGTFSEIVIDLSLVDVTTDGLFLQLSIADDPDVHYSETTSSGVCPVEEIIIRTWSTEDGCGNENFHVQKIVVLQDGTDASLYDGYPVTDTLPDVTPPMVITQDITVYLDEMGEATVDPLSLDNGSSDNCGIDSITANQVTFNCGDVGDNMVNVTIVDINGNQSSEFANVSVLDTIAPDVNVSDITIALDENGEASITELDLNGSWTDACGIDAVEISDTSFNCDDIGVQEIFITVFDVSGNISSEAFNVTITDSIAPIIYSVPTDTVIYEITKKNKCFVNVDFDSLGIFANDNCSDVDVVFDPPSGSFDLTESPVEISVSVSDEQGNQRQDNFFILVEKESPKFKIQKIKVNKKKATIRGKIDNKRIISIQVDWGDGSPLEEVDIDKKRFKVKHKYAVLDTYDVEFIYEDICDRIFSELVTIDINGEKYEVGEDEEEYNDSRIGWNMRSLERGFTHENDLKIFPNPASDYLNILLPDKSRSLSIFNLEGKVVLNVQLNGQSSYRWIPEIKSPGIYIIQVNTGEKVWVEKCYITK